MKRLIQQLLKQFIVCNKLELTTILIFNYSKITSGLQIIETTPKSCDCSNSIYCFKPAGHNVTGELYIIKVYSISSNHIPTFTKK